MNEKKKPGNFLRLTNREILEEVKLRLDTIEEHLADKKHKYSIDPGIAAVIAATIIAGATLLGFATL